MPASKFNGLGRDARADDRLVRFDRYAEADVSEYGKNGRGSHDHLFPDF